MTPIRFVIIGTPEPQGSARGFVVFLKDQYGKLRWHPKTHLPLARAAITSDNPNLKRWRATVAEGARLALGGVSMTLSGAWHVELQFFVAPPQHMPKDRGGLPIVRDDLDKLARGVLDGLTGIIWRDDGQVTDLVALKRYAAPGTPARVDVSITEVVLTLPLFSERTFDDADQIPVPRASDRPAAPVVPW